MQATVASFEPADGTGTVLLDNGVLLAFPGSVFAAASLRLLRPGQRVFVVVSGAEAPAVTQLSLLPAT
ncbi:MAG: hypothetical protein ACR2KL_04320 [Nocardioidaceae bacterium]